MEGRQENLESAWSAISSLALAACIHGLAEARHLANVPSMHLTIAFPIMSAIGFDAMLLAIGTPCRFAFISLRGGERDCADNLRLLRRRANGHIVHQGPAHILSSRRLDEEELLSRMSNVTVTQWECPCFNRLNP